MHNHIGHKSPSLSSGRMRADKRVWHLSCDETPLLRENVVLGCGDKISGCLRVSHD
jgi:hypothetical protein